MIGRMELYGQDPEFELLARLARRLENRAVIDVGAERGVFALAMLAGGAEALHAFEPHPDNIGALRQRLGDEPRAQIHEYAIGEKDVSAQLRLASSPEGMPLPFGHTLLERVDTDEIVWREAMVVTQRSLGSLIEAGEIPNRTGILKVDTEGNDLAVIRGMGPLVADVVMVEHWTDLPHGLGRCPWTSGEIVDELAARGFTHFAFLAHRGEFITLKWDDAAIERGAMGNLVFIHDRIIDRVFTDVLDCAGSLAERAVSLGQRRMHEASERLAIINELRKAADERLALIEELDRTAKERLDLIDRLTAAAQRQRRDLPARRAGRL